MKKINVFLVCVFALVPTLSFATIIDFEDITATGGYTTETVAIPSLSEDGFIFDVTDGSGHAHIWDSGHASYNGNGTDWFIHESSSLFTITRSDKALFTFNGFDAASWNNIGATSTLVYGYVNGTLINTITVDLTNTWTSFDLGNTFASVDTIKLGEGGYDNILLNTTNTNTSVPEPTSLALFGLGLMGLSFLRKRKSA